MMILVPMISGAGDSANGRRGRGGRRRPERLAIYSEQFDFGRGIDVSAGDR
jgi:hypothetical protein